MDEQRSLVGAAGAPPPRRRRARLLPLAAALAAGAAALLSVSTGGTVTSTTEPPAPAALAPLPTPAPPIGDPGRLAGRLVATLDRRPGPLTLSEWRGPDAAPTPTVLPDGLVPGSLAWDAGRHATAALGRGEEGAGLYAGSPGQLRALTDGGVTAFAWHDTIPGELAWTERSPGGQLLIQGRPLDDDPVRREIGVVAGPVVAWGTWGYLVQGFRVAPADPTGPMLVAYDPQGRRRAETPGRVSGRVNHHSRVVPLAGDLPVEGWGIVDPHTGKPARVTAPTAVGEAVVGSALGRVAWVLPVGEQEAVLEVHDLDGRLVGTFDTLPGRIVDWTADGRWIVLLSLVSQVEDDSVFPPLFVVDTATGAEHEIRYERGDLIGAMIRPGDGD